MALDVMIRKLTLKNLLSFGPEGVELELGALNVLIGPNASGKSNLIDAIRILAACPKDVSEPIVKGGGFDAWWHKSSVGRRELSITANVELPDRLTNQASRSRSVRHEISIAQSYDKKPVISEERVFEVVPNKGEAIVYDRQDILRKALEKPRSGSTPTLREISATESAFSRGNHHSDSPGIYLVGLLYRETAIYSDWNTSRSSQIRSPQPADADSSRLSPEGSNLSLVLSTLDNRPQASRQIVEELRRFYPRARAVKTPVIFGQIGGFIEEEGLHENIPFARLSDGTLRWLCLITVLLHPEPPSLICLEEPEVGLHPDMIPHLAQMLVEASRRSQLIVTTHSDLLVSALSNRPKSIVVCEHNGGSTEFRRLDPEPLKKYIADYRLGEAWLEGRLGGTRY